MGFVVVVDAVVVGVLFSLREDDFLLVGRLGGCCLSIVFVVLSRFIISRPHKRKVVAIASLSKIAYPLSPLITISHHRTRRSASWWRWWVVVDRGLVLGVWCGVGLTF